MRLFYKGSKDESLTQIMQRPSPNGGEGLLLQAEIKGSHGIECADGRQFPPCIELGVADPKYVTQAQIDAFFARPDIQKKLRAMAELYNKVWYECTVELGLDLVNNTAFLQHEWTEHDRREAEKAAQTTKSIPE